MGDPEAEKALSVSTILILILMYMVAFSANGTENTQRILIALLGLWPSGLRQNFRIIGAFCCTN